MTQIFCAARNLRDRPLPTASRQNQTILQFAKFVDSSQQIRLALVEGQQLRPLVAAAKYPTLCSILESDDPAATVGGLIDSQTAPVPVAGAWLLAPIDRQEVWAAGVTYRRSRTARMEESQGAARFYDLVYEAARPELFFKGNPHRCVGPGEAVRIRRDARWNVPEPELTLVLNSRQQLVGYTVGNDMSSRDIEGENPLYLPQAKVYDGCCALGPWITLAAAMPPLERIGIRLTIRRQGQVVFGGETSAGNLNRTPADLIGWLCRESSFPDGALLLTGTGIVPGDDFTLAVGDTIDISIDGIGTLTNTVAS